MHLGGDILLHVLRGPVIAAFVSICCHAKHDNTRDDLERARVNHQRAIVRHGRCGDAASGERSLTHSHHVGVSS